MIQIYDIKNIDQLPWPKNEESEQTKKFLLPLIKNGINHYIDNIETQMVALLIDDLVLPVTINQGAYDNSFVCSPYGHYVSCTYAMFELLKSKFLKKLFKTCYWGVDQILRLGKINHVIIVNNWLFATDLHPFLTELQISKIKEILKKTYPNHAILFRSIHTYDNSNLYNNLKKNHFQLIASRQVYFLNTKKEDQFKSRLFKSDLKLLKECKYEILHNNEIPEDAIQRMTDLYRTIYIKKHTKNNPQLNFNYIKLMLESQIIQFKALRIEGRIDAVAGYFQRNGVMYSPFLGYDITQPKEIGLYRLASTLLTQEARSQRAIFHLSSGATFYKKIRKAEVGIEYNAVYHNHLPLKRRLPWLFLRAITNSLGIQVMKRY